MSATSRSSARPRPTSAPLSQRFYSSGKTSTQAAKDPETSMYKYINSLFPMLKGEDIYTLVKTVNTEMITMNSLTEDEKKNLKQSLDKAKSQIHDAFVLDGSVRNTKFTRSMKILVYTTPFDPFFLFVKLFLSILVVA